LDYDLVHHKVDVTDVGDKLVGVVNANTNELLKVYSGFDDSQIEQPRDNPADQMIYVAFRATNKLARFETS
jgi:hypothetical protein